MISEQPSFVSSSRRSFVSHPFPGSFTVPASVVSAPEVPCRCRSFAVRSAREGSLAIPISPLELLLLEMASGFYLGAFLLYLAEILISRLPRIPWAPVTAGVGGVLFQSLAIFIRFGFQGHVALLSLREALSFFSWSLVLTFLYLEHQKKVRILGLFIFAIAFLSTLMVIGISFHSPILSSKEPIGLLLSLHTILIDLGLASAALSFIVSLLYLLLDFFLRRKIFNRFFSRIPSLETLDQLNTNFSGLGFVFLTIGLFFAIIWSWEKFGRALPYESRGQLAFIGAFLVWFAYMAIVLLRWSRKFRGKQAAYLSIAGFLIFAATMLVLALFSKGTHFIL
jgi:ABC-type transport system involved in cytochrome c biogenesis permease subunit